MGRFVRKSCTKKSIVSSRESDTPERYKHEKSGQCTIQLISTKNGRAQLKYITDRYS